MEKIISFKDIPKLTSQGAYEPSVELRYVKDWVVKNQDDLGLQLNPDFQRGNVWTEEQQINYVQFILKGGTSSKVIMFNYPFWGNFVEKPGAYNEMVCVDGLQRLTAVMRFIDNEIKVFGSYYKEFKDKPSFETALKFNVNNLKTKAEVLQWYLELNSAGTVHSADELAKVKGLLDKELQGNVE